MKKMILITALALCSAGLTFAQGSLTPPGAPGATMKTLEEIDAAVAGVSNQVAIVSGDMTEVKHVVKKINPRTPISSLPYTISEPGSYYITTNLTSSTDGVTIQADNVTLDLMGFTLSGDRGSSDYGVFIDGATNSPNQCIEVRNGVVRDFGFGVRASFCNDSLFHNLRLTRNSYYGLYLNGYNGECKGNRAMNCIMNNNHIGIVIEGGGANGDTCGNTIEHCTMAQNGNYGIILSGVNGGNCDGNIIANCNINENGSHGIELWTDGDGSCDGNTVENCTVTENGAYGIYLLSRSGSSCMGNVVQNCTVARNASDGIRLDGYLGGCVGNKVVDNVFAQNVNHGIYIYYDSDRNVVKNNVVSETSGETSYGIRTYGATQNFIMGNFCSGNTNNFSISTSNVYGPIVADTGALSSAGDASHPGANFSQ